MPDFPDSMSLIVDCLSPNALPICVCVRPAVRRDEIVRDMFMPSIIGTPILKVNRKSDSFGADNIGMSIGSRIREARKRAKLTQGELASKVGLKQGSISELETGESTGTTLIASFAAALGVNALWLETGKGLPNPSPLPDQEAHQSQARLILAYEDEAGLLDLFRRADERGQFEIIKFAAREASRVDGNPR